MGNLQTRPEHECDAGEKR